VAYGGAGPLHAARLAQSLGVPRVVVPVFSSAFSALGCLTSDLRYDLGQTYLRPLDAAGMPELAARFEPLEAAAAAPLARERHTRAEIVIRRGLDLRYAGQNYELEVPLADGPAGFDHEAIRARFAEQHRALYSYATDEPVECVTLRVAALVPGAVLRLPEQQPRGASRLADDQPCMMPGFGQVRAAVYRRAGLPVEEPLDGPALIEDDQSTTVVLPDQRAWADRWGNLHLEAGR
jgi:N-methylhydantoinase A